MATIVEIVTGVGAFLVFIFLSDKIESITKRKPRAGDQK